MMQNAGPRLSINNVLSKISYYAFALSKFSFGCDAINFLSNGIVFIRKTVYIHECSEMQRNDNGSKMATIKCNMKSNFCV